MDEKTCRNCGKIFTNYKKFKIHIKECNNDRMNIGDSMKEGF